jgi:hypothetical protein
MRACEQPWAADGRPLEVWTTAPTVTFESRSTALIVRHFAFAPNGFSEALARS